MLYINTLLISDGRIGNYMLQDPFKSHEARKVLQPITLDVFLKKLNAINLTDANGLPKSEAATNE